MLKFGTRTFILDPVIPADRAVGATFYAIWDVWAMGNGARDYFLYAFLEYVPVRSPCMLDYCIP